MRRNTSAGRPCASRRDTVRGALHLTPASPPLRSCSSLAAPSFSASAAASRCRSRSVISPFTWSKPRCAAGWCSTTRARSEEHTSELQSHLNLVCRLLLEKKKKNTLYLHLRQKNNDNRSDLNSEKTK